MAKQLYILPVFINQSENIISHVFSILSKYINKSTTVFVAVSGGVDSVSMLYILHMYFIDRKLNLKNLIVLHYHHQQRDESDLEHSCIYSHCMIFGLDFISSSLYIQKHESQRCKKITEKNMRERRYDFFMSVMARYQRGNDFQQILSLGHHIDDRIETTMMHLQRGASLQGVSNMNEYTSFGYGYNNILRPLIKCSKKDIYMLAKTYTLHFFEDKTNLDGSLSQRNSIRKMFDHSSRSLHVHPDRYTHRNKTYQHLQSILTEVDSKSTLDIAYKEIPKVWSNVCMYVFLSGLTQPHDVYILFQKLRIFSNMSSSKIFDFYIFFTKETGWKSLGSLVFYANRDGIYILGYESNPSSSKKTPLPKIDISHLILYIKQSKEFAFETVYKKKRKDLLENEIMLGDGSLPIGSKSYSRRCMNQKIPLFFRESLLFHGSQDLKKLLYNKSQLVAMGFL